MKGILTAPSLVLRDLVIEKEWDGSRESMIGIRDFVLGTPKTSQVYDAFGRSATEIHVEGLSRGARDPTIERAIYAAGIVNSTGDYGRGSYPAAVSLAVHEDTLRGQTELQTRAYLRVNAGTHYQVDLSGDPVAQEPIYLLSAENIKPWVICAEAECPTDLGIHSVESLADLVEIAFRPKFLRLDHAKLTDKISGAFLGTYGLKADIKSQGRYLELPAEYRSTIQNHNIDGHSEQIFIRSRVRAVDGKIKNVLEATDFYNLARFINLQRQLQVATGLPFSDAEMTARIEGEGFISYPIKKGSIELPEGLLKELNLDGPLVFNPSAGNSSFFITSLLDYMDLQKPQQDPEKLYSIHKFEAVGPNTLGRGGRISLGQNNKRTLLLRHGFPGLPSMTPATRKYLEEEKLPAIPLYYRLLFKTDQHPRGFELTDVEPQRHDPLNPFWETEVGIDGRFSISINDYTRPFFVDDLAEGEDLPFVQMMLIPQPDHRTIYLFNSRKVSEYQRRS